MFAQGLGNTTIFCGDGINDLAALSAADVGMSIGATDAVIAAALSTPQGSVSGRSSLKLHSMALLKCFLLSGTFDDDAQMRPCLSATSG